MSVPVHGCHDLRVSDAGPSPRGVLRSGCGTALRGGDANTCSHYCPYQNRQGRASLSDVICATHRLGSDPYHNTLLRTLYATGASMRVWRRFVLVKSAVDLFEIFATGRRFAKRVSAEGGKNRARGYGWEVLPGSVRKRLSTMRRSGRVCGLSGSREDRSASPNERA